MTTLLPVGNPSRAVKTTGDVSFPLVGRFEALNAWTNLSPSTRMASPILLLGSN